MRVILYIALFAGKIIKSAITFDLCFHRSHSKNLTRSRRGDPWKLISLIEGRVIITVRYIWSSSEFAVIVIAWERREREMLGWKVHERVIRSAKLPPGTPRLMWHSIPQMSMVIGEHVIDYPRANHPLLRAKWETCGFPWSSPAVNTNN